jgi:hypothetical protein
MDFFNHENRPSKKHFKQEKTHPSGDQVQDGWVGLTAA